MSHVIKDAFWQILGRVASAIGGFLVIKLMTPYLGPIRYGDYSTILKYFAIWSALADFGVYVIALRELGKLKNQETQATTHTSGTSGQEGSPSSQLTNYYSKFVSSRFFMIFVIYSIALVIAYFIPSYTANPYLIRGLPLGMLFSASFMAAGILQLPLQLYRKMEQVSIGLIIARLLQLLILGCSVYFIYPQVHFNQDGPITPFLVIVFSVLASGIAQGIYVYRQGKKLLPFTWIWDRQFTKAMVLDNRQYGFAYYLSSFHTLIVLILLSIFYPSISNFDYVGIRALALSLLEILLIVPSALGNSLIHKLSHANHETKIKSFGALLSIVVWIASIVTINFTLFASDIIRFVGGTAFLSTIERIGSDTILPYLGIVLILGFIKQVFNYSFVANHIQNKLLRSNLFGVVIGLSVGIPLILYHHLRGAIITQTILELGFAAGAWRIARQYHVIPEIHREFFAYLFVTAIGVWMIHKYIGPLERHRLLQACVINGVICLSRWYKLRKVSTML